MLNNGQVSGRTGAGPAAAPVVMGRENEVGSPQGLVDQASSESRLNLLDTCGVCEQHIPAWLP